MTISEANEERRLLRALEDEAADYAASRKALAGLVRLGVPWAVFLADQLDARLTEVQGKRTSLALEQPQQQRRA